MKKEDNDTEREGGKKKKKKKKKEKEKEKEKWMANEMGIGEEKDKGLYEIILFLGG